VPRGAAICPGGRRARSTRSPQGRTEVAPAPALHHDHGPASVAASRNALSSRIARKPCRPAIRLLVVEPAGHRLIGPSKPVSRPKARGPASMHTDRPIFTGTQAGLIATISERAEPDMRSRAGLQDRRP